MTANQIEYAKHLETGRHNRVSERHEHQDVQSRRMTAEANQRNATTNWFAAQEQQRHNYNTESATFAANAELVRHNMESEKVAGLQASETARHNKATERTALYGAINQATYWNRTASAKLQEIGVAQRNADTNRMQAESAKMQAHAAATNAATRQSELAESIRRNSLDYNARMANVNLGYGQLSELNRSNVVREMETARHNVEAEKVATSQAMSSARQADAAKQNAETGRTKANIDRYNATSNRINAYANVGRAAGSVISGVARSLTGLR